MIHNKDLKDEYYKVYQKFKIIDDQPCETRSWVQGVWRIMRKHSKFIKKIKMEIGDKKFDNFFEAFNKFHLYLEANIDSEWKEYKNSSKTLEEDLKNNKKLQNAIETLQKPLDGNIFKNFDQRHQEELKTISEFIENEVKNYKHFAKIKKYSDNFNDIDNLDVDQIEYDYKLPDLLLINPDEINNERLIKDFKR